MKGSGTKKLEHSEIFEFENTRSNVKECCDHWEKRKKQYVRQIVYTKQGHLLTKVTHYWLYRWRSHSMWCSLCRKYFCWWLQINDKNDKDIHFCKYILMLILSNIVLELILCIVLVSTEIEGYNLIKLILFVPRMLSLTY